MTEATGQVVASAQSGSELRRQGSEGKFDYSKLSLTQAKRLEMESQVKALELEKDLRDERTRLAELRKIHYHLAGASEGWEVEVLHGCSQWGKEREEEEVNSCMLGLMTEGKGKKKNIN